MPVVGLRAIDTTLTPDRSFAREARRVLRRAIVVGWRGHLKSDHGTKSEFDVYGLVSNVNARLDPFIHKQKN